jgi:hypothetical protein
LPFFHNRRDYSPLAQPSVQARFLLAVVLSFFQGGKVQEAEVRRLFHLVGEIRPWVESVIFIFNHMI